MLGKFTHAGTSKDIIMVQNSLVGHCETWMTWHGQRHPARTSIFIIFAHAVVRVLGRVPVLSCRIVVAKM